MSASPGSGGAKQRGDTVLRGQDASAQPARPAPYDTTSGAQQPVATPRVAPASPSSGESHLRPRSLALLVRCLPVWAYLLAALAAFLPHEALATATPPASYDSRAMVSRVVVGVSQARAETVRQVLAAEVTRPTACPSGPPAPAPMPVPAARLSPPPATTDGAISGIATWYGGSDGYDSDDTMADGSLFNPDDPTIVAANAWPLGAPLLVCHDGRCIRVRVRDRGSFSHAVDLSRGAFALLAPLSSGVIDVTVQPLS